jgi:hypothetical protein
LVALAGLLVVYRDQAWRYVTHLKGSPTSTDAWEPFPADDPPAQHFVAAGDIGDSGRRLDATAAAVDELDTRVPVDALLLLGDNSYPAGDPSTLDSVVFRPFARVLGHAELLAILGNHDVMDGHAAGQVDALGMPGRWWSRQLDDVLVVGLDSTLADDPAQEAWLERTLADTTALWKIVMVHHPPYSAGYQGSNDAVRATFSPLFERHGVQLVLSGHDHDYQRSKPIDGVTYIVSGAAAGTRRTGDAAFTEVSFSWHHFVEIAIWPDRLVLRAVNQDLRVADEVTVTR